MLGIFGKFKVINKKDPLNAASQQKNRQQFTASTCKMKKKSFSSMFSMFFSSLFSSLKDRIAKGADEILDHVEEKVLVLQKKMLRHFFIMLCIGAGIAALLLSLCFYLIDALQWPRYLVFLVLGLLLLIIASVRANIKD